MKTEDFDKTLRQKLLDFESGASTEEVDKLHRYITIAKGRNTGWRRFGWFYVFTLLLVISSTLIVMNVMQWNTIKELSASNAELIKHFKTIRSKVDIEESTTNTIGLNKVNEQTTKITTGKKNNFKQSNSVTANVGWEVRAQKIEKNQKSNSWKAGLNSDASKNAETQESSEKTNDGSINKNKESHSDEKSAQQTQLSEIIQSEGIEKEYVNQNVENSTTHFSDSIVETIGSKNRNTNETPNDSDSSIKMLPTLAQSPGIGFNNNLRDSLRRLPKYRMQRVGAEIQKANGLTSVGIIGDVFFTKHFGFSGGVRYALLQNRKYENEDEYRHEHGKDIRNSYLPNLSDTVQALNIEAKCTMIQIPVSLNFNLPLQRQFSLLFSLGTDIDVSGIKKLEYETRYHGDAGNQQHEAAKMQVSPFNNLSISTAIEKQWSRFTLQASPFISPQLKKTDYKTERLYYGLRMRVYYRF